MPELVLVKATEMSREELRGIGLRIYGEPQHGGHFVAREALIAKIESSGRKLYNITATVATPPTAEAAGVIIKVAQIVYRDGTPSVAGRDPSTIRIVNWGHIRGGVVSNPVADGWLKICREILVPVIKRDVTIDVPHNSRSIVPNTLESMFKIHVWATPEARDGGEPSYDPPRILWGMELQTRDAMDGVPWTEGIDVCSPEYPERPIAGFDENNLYIYSDLCHNNSPREVEIFKKIIQYVAENYARAKLVETDPAALRADYVRMVEKRKQIQVREITNRLNTVQTELTNLNKKVFDGIREERQCLKEIAVLDNDADFSTPRFTAEYDRLAANPLIQQIRMRNGNITVRTNTLTVVDPRSKKEHEVGRMSIHIDIKRYNIVVTNLDRQVTGMQPNMHGPHVFPTGRMCLGNMEEVLPKLVAGYQIADAIELVIAILQTCNVDDAAGKMVHAWPLSVKQQEIDKEAARELRRAARAAAGQPVEVDTVETVVEGILEGEEETPAVAEAPPVAVPPVAVPPVAVPPVAVDTVTIVDAGAGATGTATAVDGAEIVEVIAAALEELVAVGAPEDADEVERTPGEGPF